MLSKRILAVCVLGTAVGALWLLIAYDSKETPNGDLRSKAIQNLPEDTRRDRGIPKNRHIPAGIAVSASAPVSTDIVKTTSLLRPIREHGSVEYLNARDTANAIALTGYEKLRWELFKIDPDAISRIIDEASKTTEENLLLETALEIIPFDDDACTLSQLSREPRKGTGASQTWTIAGRCLENRSRRVTLKTSNIHQQIRGRVSTRGLLHYELVFVTEGYVLFTELDRSTLPRNRY